MNDGDIEVLFVKSYPLKGTKRDGLGRIGEMADQWLFKSETYDNCNCAMNCGCQFNLPSTHGYCQSAFGGTSLKATSTIRPSEA